MPILGKDIERIKHFPSNSPYDGILKGALFISLIALPAVFAIRRARRDKGESMPTGETE